MSNKKEKIRIALMEESLSKFEKGDISIERSSGNNSEISKEVRQLLETVVDIKNIPHKEPRPGFKNNARLRLMNTIRAEKPNRQVATQKTRTNKFNWRTFSTGFAILTLFTLLFVQTTAASARALPGDTLYSVKIAYEGTHLALSNNIEDAKLHLKFAQNRLVEIEVLAGRGDYDRLPLAISQFEEHILVAQQNILRTSVEDWETFEKLSIQLTDTLKTHKEMLFFIQSAMPAAEREMISETLKFTESIPLFTIPINPKTGFLR